MLVDGGRTIWVRHTQPWHLVDHVSPGSLAVSGGYDTEGAERVAAGGRGQGQARVGSPQHTDTSSYSCGPSRARVG